MSSTQEPRRIGIFGGTFDPPHVGHLLAASDAAEQLELDLLLWVPVGTQPLKRGAPVASGDDRVRMVELTIAGDPRFGVDASEVTRGGLSFTVDTLEEIRERFAGVELFLLLGEDAWRTFGQWREPARIRELAGLAILTRNAGEDDGPQRSADSPARLQTRRIDVSATEIRSRVRAGLPIRGFVIEGVERYIAENGLYQ